MLVPGFVVIVSVAVLGVPICLVISFLATRGVCVCCRGACVLVEFVVVLLGLAVAVAVAVAVGISVVVSVLIIFVAIGIVVLLWVLLRFIMWLSDLFSVLVLATGEVSSCRGFAFLPR